MKKELLQNMKRTSVCSECVRVSANNIVMATIIIIIIIITNTE
jgi:hypothetical protein